MRIQWVWSILVLPVWALLMAAPVQAGEFDWPGWRGPHRDGISKETGLLTQWPEGGPKLLWSSQKVNNGKSVGLGYSSVSVADGRIFTMGDRDGQCYVYALDEKTGEHLWATPITRANGDGPRCTPTVDGDRLYALSRHGTLACLSVKDGKIQWQVDYKKDFGGRMMSGWDYSESPLIDGDRLICTPGGEEATLMALNKHNGEVIWKSSVPNARGSGYASIVKTNGGGVEQYVTLLGRCIVGVNAENGKLLWRYDRIANGTANIPTPIVWEDLVFCSTAYNTGSALLKLVPTSSQDVDAKELYFLTSRTLQNHHGGMIRLGDYVYGGHGHNRGEPFCLNVKTGKMMWGPMNGPGGGSAAVVYADGHLYFRYQTGVMALIEATPEEYRLKGSFKLPAYKRSKNSNRAWPQWPHPVVANGRLFIRGNDEVLCFDVKKD